MNEALTIERPRLKQTPVALRDADLPALADHLLRLSPEDRYLRFQGKVNEAAIRAYVQRINLHRDAVRGVYIGTMLVAVCQVGVYLEGGDAVGEVGMSVDTEFRGTGLGRRLIDAARKVAAERGVRRLDFVFLRTNVAMLRLARAMGAEVSFEDGEWTARLDLAEARAMPHVTEMRGTTAGIEVLATEGDAARTALLVHGAGGDPWQFRRHFTPYLSALGLRVVALSLRHHGQSARTGSLRLAQHVSDVLDVIRNVGQPQILIGHSMGALVAQHVVQQLAVPRMALLAPIPPDGLPGTELTQALGALKTTASRTALAGALAGYAPLASRGGARETCVIGGRHDRVVSPAAVRRTAAFHGTSAVMLDAGHVLMSGSGWREAADTAVGLVRGRLNVRAVTR
jgi:GNAT superfamily N-acetyltransferase/predicted alpha/beta hydrolase family esterase